VEIFHSLLGSVWALVAAIVGSCSAIIVSVVGVWNSRRQLRIQLEQQAHEFKTGREMTLRRDVYLEAAVAVARATNSLNELADIHSPGAELTRQYAADFATIAKVHVIGAPETIDALMRVTLELGDAQAELNAARLPILDLQRDLEAAPPGTPQHAARWRAWTEARLGLAELALSWAARAAAHMPAAIAAIRAELDLPRREAYRESFERAWEHSQQHLRASIRKIRDELQSPRQGEPARVEAHSEFRL
jgi:hypothetical protein